MSTGPESVEELHRADLPSWRPESDRPPRRGERGRERAHGRGGAEALSPVRLSAYVPPGPEREAHPTGHAQSGLFCEERFDWPCGGGDCAQLVCFPLPHLQFRESVLGEQETMSHSWFQSSDSTRTCTSCGCVMVLGGSAALPLEPAKFSLWVTRHGRWDRNPLDNGTRSEPPCEPLRGHLVPEWMVPRKGVET